MFRRFVRQFNIIKALAIHNLQGQMKSYNYGFAWVLLEPLLYIFVFRMARKVLGGGGNPAGMTPMMYFLLGVFPLYFFLEGMKAGRAATKRSTLLYFPRVSQLDVAFGNGISSLAIHLGLLIVVAPAVAAYEGAMPPENVNSVLFAMLISWLMGVPVGFVFGGLTRVFPPMQQFLGYVSFGLRMVSGMFFCIRDIPQQYWPYLTWNPLLHATEMARDGWFETYTSPIASPMYIIQCTLGLLLFGLSIERFMRRVPYV
ncbi:MAG TPA: ABC transporter permease [Acidobacteriaceae bacterium]|nr:ABC transporter permease [Acidobacteriaceae bacterium]